MSDPIVEAAAPASPAPAEPVATPAPEKTLAQFRAERAAPVEPEAPAPQAAPPAPAPQASAEPPEPPDEPEINPAGVKAPEQGGDHRWTDPETGIRLDLRRKDHKRMKRALEDRAALAQRILQAQQQPQAQRPAPQAVAPQPDPNDPEPSLEQFADQPDPYAAFVKAQARWEARQEFRTQTAQRESVERTQRVKTAIESRQAAFDAALPEVRERYPDFDAAYTEVFETLARVPMGQRAPIVHRLLTDRQGHDLTHFLGNTPQAMEYVVSARTPSEQQYRLGQIAAHVRTLTRPRAAAPVNPPAAPMAPVNGGGTPTAYNPATANLAQFRKKHGVRGGRSVAV